MSSEGNEKQDALLSSLVQTVRSSSSLAAQDIEFYRSLDSNVNTSLEQTSSNILSLINDVLLSIDPNSDVVEAGKDAFADSWKVISNTMDNLFEKSDHALDNIRSGNNNNGNGSSLKYLNDDDRSNSSPAKRIVKPQLSFTTPVDNTESHPFKPLLNVKPNAIKPLEVVRKMVPEEEGIPAHSPHPYEYEIDTQEYNDAILVKSDPIPSKDWDSMDATWVDTVEGLKKMKDELSKATELALDLEHHDYRSYHGIVCLMQISDRNQDWIVDTIALRDELHILNDIFTDPKVTKVLHGAFMDIIWLQRDLGLYIVSLFDTYHASRMLGFPKHSLAYLLERFANFKTSKKYQLADWRQRPLTKPMLAYARADTHFLLNIFDQLRNTLIESNKISEVLHESRKVAKRRFEYSSFRPKVPTPQVFTAIEKEEPWRNIMFQYNIPPSKELLLRKLFEWRDTIARRDDESPRYVMPNQLLVSLVAGAPTEPINVLSISSYVSEHVRANSKAISNLIKRTLEESKEGNNGFIPTTTALQPADVDAAKVLSISQIQSVQRLFNSIADQAKSLTNADSLPESNFRPSLLFNGGLIQPPRTAVSYTPAGKKVLTEKDVSDRYQEYVQVLEKEYTDKATQNILLQSLTPEKESEHHSVEATLPIESPEAEIEEIEDKTEIVTLRKPSKQNKKNRTPTEVISSSEVIDYTTGPEILSKDRKKIDQGKNKKRRFDPYAVESVGPQAVKKKSKPVKGKNVSFKR